MIATGITVREVVEHLAFETAFSAEQIMGRGRSAYLCELRIACLWCAREITNLTLINLGRAFNRDHATVIGLLNRAAYLREWDPELRALTDGVVRCLRDHIWEIAA
ncbi:helix-turn-helix domain-containing protein [Sphingomonas sp.]|uniref:helix-turn-helix domain-containing protein n=1 Tax=Sphingomonas sp. TaxID=28214 RepID=UPI003CC62C0E